MGERAFRVTMTALLGRVYEISPNGISAQDGSSIDHPVGWYTVNDVPN
jgi:hypothetical protein